MNNQNFIKDLYEKKENDFAHHQFIRYSLGRFEKEEFKITITSKNIKFNADFEYVGVLQKMFAEFAEEEIIIKGVIVTIDDIESKLNKYGILKNIARRYGKSGSKYELEGNLSPEKFKEFINEFELYYLLFDAQSGNQKIKISKKETPKIGGLKKNFIRAEFDKKNKEKIIEQFLFLEKPKEFKKAIIHSR